jgi:diguanylate cyclase (GGDEF)-like protein
MNGTAPPHALSAIIGWTAAAALAAAALMLPAGLFFLTYRFTDGGLRTEAAIRADLVSQLIAHDPENWQYQAHRIEALLDMHLGNSETRDSRSIADPQGRLVGRSSGAEQPPWPTMTRMAPLYDAGRIVGELRVTRSLRSLGTQTALLAAVAVALALCAYLALRRLPLRALRQKELRLSYLAHFDTLTGLPNRTTFHSELERAMARSRNESSVLALLYLDIDRFKTVNDTLGHEAGDALLKEAAVRLRAAVRREDLVARLGGDEFAVIAERIGDAEDAGKIAHHIAERMHDPFIVRGHAHHLGASVGIAVYPSDAGRPDQLLRCADIAMYSAKELRQGATRYYRAEMNERAQRNVALEDDLRKAIEGEQFLLHYQPIVCTRSGALTGVEALLRWRHPSRGLVPPGEFIQVLEDTGLIVPVGAWVLRAACGQTRLWTDAGMPPVRISVNLSPRQFRAAPLLETVRHALQDAGIAAERLQLEITETALVDDVETAADKLRALADLGVGIALDDFGTGYSSLTHLKDFPLHALKIDKSFVANMHESASDECIVASVIGLAHGLRLSVVAEGVETEAQACKLREVDCDSLQGFYFSRPLPAEDLAAWHARREIQSTAVPAPAAASA